jgi:hypothetical protein
MKLTIQFKIFTNIYKVKVTHLTLIFSCKNEHAKWNIMQCEKCVWILQITNIFINIRMLLSLITNKN